MDQDKPFKSVEVLDSRTGQICKVACMSCIRGHRTTSCGIPVCRTKLFWTVKRPGRPANACTCRYAGGGGCKCVVAKSACPHKTKKGDKRSGECRCDEMGRFCCLIEPEHWVQLIALQRPAVDFFSSREALEAKQMADSSMSFSHTPAYSVASPAPFSSAASTPGSQFQSLSSPYGGLHLPTSTTLTPRFSMLGIGGLQRDAVIRPPEILAWGEQALPAPPRHLEQPYYQQEEQSCCQGPAAPDPSTGLEQPFSHQMLQASTNQPSFPLVATSLQHMSMAPAIGHIQPSFNMAKLTEDYFNYRFPSAICQSCGLSGCTCRSCPPVMQSFSNGSWAQCCGRKHARPVSNVGLPGEGEYSIPERPTKRPQIGEQSLPPGSGLGLSEFDFEKDFAIPDGSQPMDFSDMLISEADDAPEQGGCCCGDP